MLPCHTVLAAYRKQSFFSRSIAQILNLHRATDHASSPPQLRSQRESFYVVLGRGSEHGKCTANARENTSKALFVGMLLLLKRPPKQHIEEYYVREEGRSR